MAVNDRKLQSVAKFFRKSQKENQIARLFFLSLILKNTLQNIAG
jgi:hypothetical protein